MSPLPSWTGSSCGATSRSTTAAIAAVGFPAEGSGIAVPGLVDLQVNGLGGIDVLQATTDEILVLGVELARTGVLWYQPTLVTAPVELTRLALATIGDVGRRLRRADARRPPRGPVPQRRSARARIPSSTCGSPISTCSPRSSSPAVPSRTVTLAPELPRCRRAHRRPRRAGDHRLARAHRRGRRRSRTQRSTRGRGP